MSIKKVVCISCFDYYEIRMKSIMKFFKENGYETYYLTSDFQHYSKQRFKSEYSESIQLHVPSYRRNLSVRRMLSHFIFSMKVYQQIKTIEPDIIYCECPPNSLVHQVIRYKKKHNTRVIFDMFDLWPEGIPYEKFKVLLELPFKIWRNLRDFNIPKANLIVCVSQRMEDNLKRIHPNIKTAVLFPTKIKEEGLSYNSHLENEINFCYLGSINHLTDISLIIDLLSKTNKRRKVVLHIIGAGQNLAKLVEALQSNGVESVCHGVIFDPDAKRAIFERCDFGLNIYKPEVGVTMSLKSVEYLSVGLPILSNAFADIRNIIDERNAGINFDKEYLEETVERILDITVEQLEGMRRNCLKVYEEEYINQNLDAILSSCI